MNTDNPTIPPYTLPPPGLKAFMEPLRRADDPNRYLITKKSELWHAWIEIDGKTYDTDPSYCPSYELCRVLVEEAGLNEDCSIWFHHPKDDMRCLEFKSYREAAKWTVQFSDERGLELVSWEEVQKSHERLQRLTDKRSAKRNASGVEAKGEPAIA